jgi:putative salt-induced outer membrane protein YdiY
VNENFKTVLENKQTDPDPAPPIWEKSSDDTDYAAFQLKFDFTRDLYKDDITFFHNNMYLNSLQSLSDIIIETETGIKFDMAWDLVLTAEVQTDWENEPAEDAKKLDTRYMLKIGFEFEGDENDWFR